MKIKDYVEYFFLEENSVVGNPGFVKLGQLLGKDKLFSYINKFGFGEKTGVDLSGESTGIIFPLDRVGNVELATSAFGQGVSVTPIQQVMAVSAVVNGGYLYEPYIVKSISDKTNTVIKEYYPKFKRQVISSETSSIMRYALETVVAYGGGKSAYIEGYRVGGKTGTAQIPTGTGGYKDGQYILSFIGGAPMNAPQVVVYICLDQPKNKIQYGGTVASPIVRAVLEDTLSYLKIERQSGGMEKEYTWMDQKVYTVENYIGKKKSEVKSQYFTFEFQGEGSYVIDQLPSVGTRLEQGKKIIILLGDK